MENENNTYYITIIKSILELIGALSALKKPFLWIYKQITIPTLIWGEFDYTSPLQAQYYFFVKSTNKTTEYTIDVFLKSNFHYSTKVSYFINPINYRYEFKTTETIDDHTKKIQFTIPANTSVRLTLEGTGGVAGLLLCQNYELHISTHNTKIKYKPNKMLLRICNNKKP